MKEESIESRAGLSKVRTALGAVSLLMFLIGIKRSFRVADGSRILQNGEVRSPDAED